MKSTRQLSTLAVAAAFIGTVVGAGFATGQEVLQFFSFFGRSGFIGIAVVTILFCYFGSVIMRISRDLKSDSHLELVKFICGRKLGIFMDWFITFSFLGVLVVMAAGSGAVAEEQLGFPPVYGSLAVILLSFLTVISGINNVIKAIGFVVPFLLLAVFGVTVFSIVQDPISLQKVVFLESLQSAVPAKWPFSALLYISYNILLAVAILSPLGVEARNHRSLFWGALLGGLGLGIGILAINLAIISRVPEILPFQVPMIFLASRLNPLLAYGYGFILLLEIYTTAVSILYGFTARVAFTKIHKMIWAGSACVGALFAARLGFARVISTVYPVMGFVGLFFLAGILWSQFREILSGFLRFERK
ncbi:MAG: hypothetical protein AWM53_01780 [Candidatus Dichloromethanomonas elyunquensis]|nr:MAG: hypothetical protein AWM53_01780 [Candidatus Dichloromethanomonas elyunquensis]